MGFPELLPPLEPHLLSSDGVRGPAPRLPHFFFNDQPVKLEVAHHPGQRVSGLVVGPQRDSAPLSYLSMGCQLPSQAPLDFGFTVALSVH